MHKVRRVLKFLSIATAAVMMAMTISGCSGSGDSGSSQQTPEDVHALLTTVPSDAIAVCCRNTAAEAMALIQDPRASEIPLGRLEGAIAAVSWSNKGKLATAVAIEIPRNKNAQADAAAARHIADSLGLYTWTTPADSARSNGCLVISPSQSQLNAIRSHVSESRSILDAEGFNDALLKTDGRKDFSILRVDGASSMLPQDFLSGIYTRRQSLKVIGRLADWISIIPAGKDSYSVRMSSSASDKYSANMFTRLPAGESLLGHILPRDCTWAVSMSTPLPDFRDAYTALVDANVAITDYNRRFAELKKKTGKDPLKWEKELDIQEVGYVLTENGMMAFVRPSRKTADAQPQENPYRGFIPALYGEAFGIADDSWCASRAGWTVYGNETAVRAFSEAPSPKEQAEAFNADTLNTAKAAPSDYTLQKQWPSKATHIVIYKSGTFVCWDKKGINLWNSNQ